MFDHLFHNAHGERDALFSVLAQWPLIRHYAIVAYDFTRDQLRKVRRRR